MIILALETSCDETAAAVAEMTTPPRINLLSDIVASSQSLHIKTGGIIPETASREQVRHIIPVIREALESANISISDIDALAVTVGPGLIGSLLVGVETAKTLSFVWNKPLIPVNHLFGHIFAVFLEYRNPIFPAVALVASGGHTELYLMENQQKIEWLAGTRDDAAGECFDKCARLLGLGYPGGPKISAWAEKFKVQGSKLKGKNSRLAVRLPRPLLGESTLDFSFSGLKTAVLREVDRLKTMKQWGNLAIEFLANEIQESITEVLVEKTIIAAKKSRAKSIFVSGGVAANQKLREKFKENSPVPVFIPLPGFCTDNAAMIAAAALLSPKPVPWQKVNANPNLGVV